MGGETELQGSQGLGKAGFSGKAQPGPGPFRLKIQKGQQHQGLEVVFKG